jgi:hypothetical protein
MDREILKYLYKFYSKGDYWNFHDLGPMIKKIKRGEDFKYFLDRLRIIIGYLSASRFIEFEEGKYQYGSWGTVKEVETLFDYNNLPVFARMTDEGADNIEKIVQQETQLNVSKSVLETNGFIKLNIAMTICFGVIVTAVQLMTYEENERKTHQEEYRQTLDSLRILQQTKHDSIVEALLLHQGSDSILGKKTSTK